MLTGPAIRKAVADGDISIDPYNWSFAGPNSYDERLHQDILVYDLASSAGEFAIDEQGLPYERARVLDVRSENRVEKFEIIPEGAVLVPDTLYLARTIERIHSDVYSATIHGRSSVGRLGITVHQTAAFIDVGFSGIVTLEITVVHPVRVYAGMRIGQIAFHPLVGEIQLYKGKYQGAQDVEASKLFKDDDGKAE